MRTSAGKQTVHDGPWAETREQLGGLYIIEAPDLDAAIAIAKKVPLLEDGAMENPGRLEMMTAPAGKEEMSFRYAVNPGGVTFDIHHWCFVQCIQPTHDKPVIIPRTRSATEIPIGLGRCGDRVANTPCSIPVCGGVAVRAVPIGPVKPVEDDEMFLAFDVPEAGHIRLIDLNNRFCIRKPALPGGHLRESDTVNGSFQWE